MSIGGPHEVLPPHASSGKRLTSLRRQSPSYDIHGRW